MEKSDRIMPDTNVLISYLMRDNLEQFAAAEAFFEEVRSGKKKAVILESVIVESLYVLTKFYGIPRAVAAGPLIEIMHYKGVGNDDASALVDTLKLFAESGLDPVDCLLAARQNMGKGEVFTFDKELKRVATGSA
jgi:predicted nucleic-acid-binding protein